MLALALVLTKALAGCSALPPRTVVAHPIVGAWVVKDPNAPFPYHMYVFNADGTLQQANPDAGDARGSDSDGKGAWAADRDAVKGRWVEVMADRATHRYTGRLEVSFRILVRGDDFVGTESVRLFDSDGHAVEGPATPGQIEGKRVRVP